MKQPRKRSRSAPRRPVVETLEARILYSADFAPGLLEAAPSASDSELRTLDTSGEFAQAPVASQQASHARRLELVLVDSDTPDYQKLVDDILEQDGEGRSIEVIILD